MIIEVKVPQLSESVAEATLSAWHVKEGDAVARDQNLIDIETDKVVLELPAPDAGVIVRIVKQNGESVASGEVIAQIDTEAKSSAAVPATAKAATAPVTAPAAAAPTAMPAARKIMAEKGLTVVMGDINARRGRVQGSAALDGGYHEIVAHVPTAELLKYAVELRSLTAGRGRFAAEHDHYDTLPAHLVDKAKATLESVHP